jgi:hypothetical protein
MSTTETQSKARLELIDRLMDMYVEWREECVALWDAYARWSTATARDRELAFAAYRAALDREEWASYVYEDQVDRITPVLADAIEPTVMDQRLAA